MHDLLQNMAQVYRNSKMLAIGIALYFAVAAFFGFCIGFGWHLADFVTRLFK